MEDSNTNPDSNQQQKQPENLGDAGLEALRKEREARKQLEKELAEIKAKAQAGDVLAGELQLTRKQLQEQMAAKEKAESEMRSQIEERDKRIADIVVENNFNKAASALALSSEYIPLLLNAHRHEFKISDDGSVIAADGRTLQQWFEGTREKLPALFSAPHVSGSGSKESRQSNGKTKVVSRDDAKGFLSNLDGIISGEIMTE